MDTLLQKVKSGFDRISKISPAPDSSVLALSRKSALDAFSESGIPTVKNEEWKYTSLRGVASGDWEFVPVQINENESVPSFLPQVDGYRIVFINGVWNQKLSVLPEKGIVVKNISEAVASSDFEPFSKIYGSVEQYNGDGISFLNRALVSQGLFIHVKRGVSIDKPLFINYFSNSGSASGFESIRHFLVLEENASLSVIEKVEDSGTHPVFSSIVTEGLLQKDSNLNWTKIVTGSKELTHVGTFLADQQGTSQVKHSTFNLGGGLVRNNLNFRLNSAFSEAHLYGLSLLKEDEHVDNHTVVDHAVRDCQSNELFKTILDDRSTGIFNGKIFVRQDAQKTNAYQSSKNILLSKEATANAKPQLEIFADDVKCSHGSTTGQLDPESLFYLRARGVGEKMARVMLTRAYADDILSQVNDEHLKKYLEEKVSERLGV